MSATFALPAKFDQKVLMSLMAMATLAQLEEIAEHLQQALRCKALPCWFKGTRETPGPVRKLIAAVNATRKERVAQSAQALVAQAEAALIHKDGRRAALTKRAIREFRQSGYWPAPELREQLTTLDEQLGTLLDEVNGQAMNQALAEIAQASSDASRALAQPIKDDLKLRDAETARRKAKEALKRLELPHSRRAIEARNPSFFEEARKKVGSIEAAIEPLRQKLAERRRRNAEKSAHHAANRRERAMKARNGQPSRGGKKGGKKHAKK